MLRSGKQSNIIGRLLCINGINVRVMRKIGEGGFAYVYLCNRNKQTLALKRITTHDQASKDAAMAEANLSMSLSDHDAAVSVLATDVAE
ncbi:hypothetical protein KIPB_006746, partial [Kipferlia bialata]|eukprot:g6746.t1